MKSFWERAFRQPEFWFLLIFNAVLYYEYKQNPELESTIILIFYFQSVVIGFFHFFKLLYFGQSSESIETNKNVAGVLNPTLATRLGTAGFFAVHFGIFHLVYFIFLIVLAVSKKTFPDIRMIGITVGIFAINCVLSLISEIRRKKAGEQIKIHFFTPYARVIPMHLTIMLSFFVSFGNSDTGSKGLPWWTFGLDIFEVFMILKIIADLVTFAATSSRGEKTMQSEVI